MRELLLTFDVEDFTSERSFLTLRKILELMQAEGIKALFFLTGHVAEKLGSYPDVLELLNNQELGFHSTSHSVRPTIFEYSDVRSYEEAVEIALVRETSHINPFTGALEGRGGITLLRDLFPSKRIVSFRAPGYCWSPAVSQALHKLGVIFDFSTDLADNPVYYKGITFYPYAFQVFPPEGHDFNMVYPYLLFFFSKKHVTTLLFHPHSIINKTYWDTIFFSENPTMLVSPMERSQREKSHFLWQFSVFLKQISALQRAGAVKVISSLHQSSEMLKPTKQLVRRAYLRSVKWPVRCFKYHPRFLYSHYLKFFELEN